MNAKSAAPWALFQAALAGRQLAKWCESAQEWELVADSKALTVRDLASGRYGVVLP